MADDRGENRGDNATGKFEDAVDDVVGGLRLDGGATAVAMNMADAGEEEAEVVADLGDGADSGAGIATDGPLVDGGGGSQAFDVVDVRALHLAEELAGVGGERFDVAALALLEDGVKRK